MSVEAPQGQPAGGQQSRRILHHAARPGSGRELHVAQRIADLRRDAHATADHVGHARNVRATPADQYLLRLLALFSVNLFILNLLPVPVLDGGHADIASHGTGP